MILLKFCMIIAYTLFNGIVLVNPIKQSVPTPPTNTVLVGVCFALLVKTYMFQNFFSFFSFESQQNLLCSMDIAIK